MKRGRFAGPFAFGADRSVDLSVTSGPHEVRIRASNPVSPNGSRQSAGSGLGLLGLAERVALLQGRLSHQTSAGRFELAADLPTGSAT